MTSYELIPASHMEKIKLTFPTLVHRDVLGTVFAVGTGGGL